MTTLTQSFASWLYQLGYSQGTQRMLTACAAEFLATQQITDVLSIEPESVSVFYEWLHQRPLKKRPGALSEMMIHHYVYALKTFFTWLEVTEQIDYNPISGMSFKRPMQNSREPLSLVEIEALFTSSVSLRETALLHLFYSSGLRRSEGEALNTSDIRYKERLLYVRAGKGAKRRVVPMTERVATALEAYYIQERCGHQAGRVKDQDAFMLSRIGTRMSGESYNHLFKGLAGRAGTPEYITLHHLRHSIATHLLQSGMSLEYVRDFLGHSFLETTQIYARPSKAQML